LALEAQFARAWGRVLEDARQDGSLQALTLALPAERILAQALEIIDVEALHSARDFARKELASLHRAALIALFERTRPRAAYTAERAEIDRRRQHNTALAYLCAAGDAAGRALARGQLEAADNMTDSIAALACLCEIECPEREQALERFYERWQHDPLVIDKWFTVQATSSLESTPARVRELRRHPAFKLENPNRVRALIGAFATANQLRFHAPDGGGYAFLADSVLELDALNPQVAARMAGAFGAWKRFDEGRRGLMRSQLERVAGAPKLSKDVFEIVGKALG
jgi:aminopeptidase N